MEDMRTKRSGKQKYILDKRGVGWVLVISPQGEVTVVLGPGGRTERLDQKRAEKTSPIEGTWRGGDSSKKVADYATTSISEEMPI